MSTLTAEQAQSLLTLLLPQIEANQRLARLVVQALANDKLSLKPVPEGESLGDLAWYVASASAVFVRGIADGRFPAPPAKPEQETVEAFLAWDEAQYPVALQGLAGIDGDALLRPMTFGHLTLPAIEFVPIFLANLSQHTGMLMAWMAQNGASRQQAPAPAGAAGELSEEELLQVAGGAVTQTTTVSNGIMITGNYGTPSPIMQQTQAGLGTLLGNGGGGLGAVGVVGGAALIAGILGIEAALVAFGGVGVMFGAAGALQAVTFATIFARF